MMASAYQWEDRREKLLRPGKAQILGGSWDLAARVRNQVTFTYDDLYNSN